MLTLRSALRFAALGLAACLATTALADPRIIRANVIDGEDGRGSILTLGPVLGLSPAEIARIRTVSGHVGCFLPSPSVGAGALFLDSGQVLSAAHIFFTRDGKPRSKCFFRNQDSPPVTVDLLPDGGAYGAVPPRAGSNADFAIVKLAARIPGAEPFPVSAVPVMKGDTLIVVTGHPADMQPAPDPAVPVVQACTVRRVPQSSEATNFFRTDCDAGGSSSGSMNLARVDGALVFRGITITTGPWQDDTFRGAAYDEAGGSVTTALGTDAAILRAGQALAASR